MISYKFGFSKEVIFFGQCKLNMLIIIILHKIKEKVSRTII